MEISKAHRRISAQHNLVRWDSDWICRRGSAAETHHSEDPLRGSRPLPRLPFQENMMCFGTGPHLNVSVFHCPHGAVFACCHEPESGAWGKRTHSSSRCCWLKGNGRGCRRRLRGGQTNMKYNNKPAQKENKSGRPETRKTADKEAARTEMYFSRMW